MCADDPGAGDSSAGDPGAGAHAKDQQEKHKPI